MTTQSAFYFDASACVGCKSCELACKDKNNLPLGVRLRRVFEYGGGSWINVDGYSVPNQVFTYFVSAACMHCVDSPCTKACPTGAMHKQEDGVVLINTDACMGCRYCEWTCPYSAPRFNPATGVMVKCDFCIGLQALGEAPACVATCPQRCLDYGELDDLRRKYGDLDSIEPLPVGSMTNPALVVTPHRYSQISGTGTGTIRNRAEV